MKILVTGATGFVGRNVVKQLLEAGVSVRGRETVSEAGIPDEQLEEHIVSWPGQVPKGAARR